MSALSLELAKKELGLLQIQPIKEFQKELIKYLDRVRANSSCPFIVGFGIKSNDDVKWFNKYSNGAVVGSHILNHINADEDYVLKANEIINTLSKSSKI